MTGTADGDLIDVFLTDFVIDGVNLLRDVTRPALLHQLLVLGVPFTEVGVNIGNAIDGTTGRILEQEKLVLQIVRTVIQGGCRTENYPLVGSAKKTAVDTIGLANLLKFVVLAGAVATETVRLVNDDKVELLLSLILGSTFKDLV